MSPLQTLTDCKCEFKIKTYQRGLKSCRSLFWHALIREERAWTESRGRNVSNYTMQWKKICGTLSFSVYNSTVSLHQLRSEDIFHTELAVFFVAMQKNPTFLMCYPWKLELGRPSRCPPETFLPVTKFLLGRKSCPAIPSAHLTSKWKVWNNAGSGMMF